MGTLVEVDGRVGVTYFTEFLHLPSRAQLVAVVVRRHDRDSTQLRAASIWSWLRSLFPQPGPSANATPLWSPPDGWSGSAVNDGTSEVLYHSERRLVRVANREFELPSDGRTLILLVDEERTRLGEEPDIRVHSIDAPRLPHRGLDRSLDKEAILKRIQASSREQAEAWRRLIRTDPVTQAFLEGHA